MNTIFDAKRTLILASSKVRTLASLLGLLLLLHLGLAPASAGSTGPAGRAAAHAGASGAWQLDLSCGPGCTTMLHAVDMISVTDGWAVGDEGVILHWDGARWEQVASGTAAALNSVAMVSADDGWAVGDVILHWDGHTWQEKPNPAAAALQAVAMVAHDDGWAAGFRGIGYGLGYSIILRWAGAGWQVHESTVHYGLKPMSISMAGADDGWIGTFDYYEAPMLRHWDGESWGYVESPIAVVAVAAAAGYGGWAVGDGFVNLQSLAQWPTLPVWPLRGVAVVSQDEAWAVGAEGVIYYWDGKAWRRTPSPTTKSLQAVDMMSATDGWAVGEGGVILHYSGSPPAGGTTTWLPLVLRDAR